MYTTRNIGKARNSTGLLLKAVASYFLCIAIIASVSWQQFALYAKYTSSNTTKTNAIGKLSINKSSKYNISQPLPISASPLGFEADVEILEEEETKNSIEAYNDNLTEAQIAGEINYTAFLKSRYLQLTHSVYNRSTVPFFILHHSWKMNLIDTRL
ncbi:MAG: hypothetical protein RLZZ316_2141 [Bacteroidota bacterium]